MDDSKVENVKAITRTIGKNHNTGDKSYLVKLEDPCINCGFKVVQSSSKVVEDVEEAYQHHIYTLNLPCKRCGTLNTWQSRYIGYMTHPLDLPEDINPVKGIPMIESIN